MDVEATGSQLGEGPGLKPHSSFGQPDRRRHAERSRSGLALEDPLIDPVVVADDLGGLVAVLGGKMPFVHVRRLDRVIVDADQNHVVHMHRDLPSTVLVSRTSGSRPRAELPPHMVVEAPLRDDQQKSDPPSTLMCAPVM